MVHESLLVVSTRGESIGKIIHHDGDETFLVERGTVFPKDFALHCESITEVSDDGALVYTLTEYPEEQPARPSARDRDEAPASTEQEQAPQTLFHRRGEASSGA